jgi:hypothetical protein
VIALPELLCISVRFQLSTPSTRTGLLGGIIAFASTCTH